MILNLKEHCNPNRFDLDTNLKINLYTSWPVLLPYFAIVDLFNSEFGSRVCKASMFSQSKGIRIVFKILQTSRITMRRHLSTLPSLLFARVLVTV